MAYVHETVEGKIKELEERIRILSNDLYTLQRDVLTIVSRLNQLDDNFNQTHPRYVGTLDQTALTNLPKYSKESKKEPGFASRRVSDLTLYND